MSKLAALLGGMTLTDLAKEILGSQGRGGDTELAHVNKREAALLKSQGGSGTVNPQTGMTEFQDSFDYPMDMGVEYSTDVEAQPGGFYGDVGQPTPPAGGGQTASPPQEISVDPFGGFPGAQYDPGGAGYDPYAPTSAYQTGVVPSILEGSSGPISPISKYESYLPGKDDEDPYAVDPMEGYRQRNILDEAKSALAGGPSAPGAPGGMTTGQRVALAAGLSLPGMYYGQKARREAQRTRREMEQMAAPIRQAGEEQLAAGRRGELTPAQQQQVQAARAASRQDLARRGVTSGTAAQQAENRIRELEQRFVQNNIDNGVRLIGAANSYNAQAIQMAYKMNADANAMTASYFNNLMRASGALPSPVYAYQTGG